LVLFFASISKLYIINSHTNYYEYFLFVDNIWIIINFIFFGIYIFK